MTQQKLSDKCTEGSEEYKNSKALGEGWGKMRPNRRVGISGQITCGQWASKF